MPLIDLARAMRYRRDMWAEGNAPGSAQAALRNRIMAMPVEELGEDLMREAAREAGRLAELEPSDMPATVDDLALLIDTIAMRHGFTARADAWREIGINPNRGRDLLARNAKAIDWPIFFTALTYAVRKE